MGNFVIDIETLARQGFVQVAGLLEHPLCEYFKDQYADASLYRGIISMERYRFGRGEYKYFSYPLPEKIQRLRRELYSAISPVASEWMERLKLPVRYPSSHEDFIRECHRQEQTRPTPLILKYEAAGYNTLHQDLYGEIFFPFQVVIPLSQRGVDFEGGEFVLTEQVPRAQSRAHVISLDKGDGLIFTTHFRPVEGKHGYYKANVKHGISQVTKGKRFALGIIFHDAR